MIIQKKWVASLPDYRISIIMGDGEEKSSFHNALCTKAVWPMYLASLKFCQEQHYAQDSNIRKFVMSFAVQSTVNKAFCGNF